jgi:hypothetical protein
MLDPMTALGLASNVVQLITFTADLVDKGLQLSTSINGRLLDHEALDTITTSLQELTNNLTLPDSKWTDSKRKSSRTEKELRRLCADCSEVSNLLLDALKTLKMQEKRGVWSEGKIDLLSTRLEKYRRQIDTTLLVSLR